MVRAWYMDDKTDVDRREPHMLNPSTYLDLKDLEKLGVIYFQVSSLYILRFSYFKRVLTL